MVTANITSMFVQILLLFPEQEKIQIHKESHLFENSALGW